ncbi:MULTISPECIES: hypothetical protein [unclassified Cupriavidus]|uniref:hypothetical protein n=1 Tax=unclassified Cupriavidus TaxID=2640874 RepID=UPI0013661C54|nr:MULTISPECIES: hypothetical protein [unclassified Cupriavidus]
MEETRFIRGFAAACLAALLLSACGGSDDDKPTQPPAGTQPGASAPAVDKRCAP